MTPDITPERIAGMRSTVLRLLDGRPAEATICPSEVARAVAGTAGVYPKDQSWRAVMPIVHAAVDQMLDDELVALSWKGKVMASRNGPYRIRRA